MQNSNIFYKKANITNYNLYTFLIYMCTIYIHFTYTIELQVIKKHLYYGIYMGFNLLLTTEKYIFVHVLLQTFNHIFFN